ncbi:MAG: M28 family peptidase [Selenomonadaceae bacterium]|nr:M28 family peptidase [Selenomonadaceae bacterium]
MTSLEDFLRPSQKQLFKRLVKKFKGKTLISKGNFILVHGQAPVMLVAHLDTVHEEPIKDICVSADGNILMSPQGIGGDDRCGCFALVKVYRLSKIKPWLLFCCDEEIGGLGAKKFCLAHQQHQLPKEINDLKFLVELDRKGSRDAVYYHCDNPDFEAYISGKGFKTAQGSFSDISVIAPELGIAAVNLSCGYYAAHTRHEYINRSQLDDVIHKVVDIVADSSRHDFTKFNYRESLMPIASSIRRCDN